MLPFAGRRHGRHSGWMNNTSLGSLDLLHVSFIHDVELVAEICG
jgi:hypothetical protein